MDVTVKKSISYDGDADRGKIGYTTSESAAYWMFDPTEIQFQHGPIQDNGYNGIQNEDVLTLILTRLRALNEKFPCRENVLAITNIEQGLMWLERRTAIRQLQGVEGKNLAPQG